MSIFSCLPRVDYCCFCISLKWGSFIIALYTLLSFAASSASMYFSERCEEGAYNTVMDIASYVVLAVSVITLLASIVFIFGIFKSIPETAIIFMYAGLLEILVLLAFIVMAIVFSILDPDCPHFTKIIAPIICFFLWLYFLIVVHSYEEKMLD